MLVFLLLVAGAVIARRRPETHKRLMLLATLSILDAIARWPVEGLAASTWAYLALTDAFIGVGMAYDLWSRGRVHAAYISGGLLILAGQLSRDLVGQTGAWINFARAREPNPAPTTITRRSGCAASRTRI